MRLAATRHALTLTLFTAAAAAALIGIPSTAHADGFVSPWAAVQFGGKLDNVSADINRGRAGFGVTAGAMGGGIIGGEVDFGYSPSFFGTDNDFGNNTVVTVMGNVIVGIPIGGQSGGGVRPYVSGGVGLIRSQVDNGTLFKVSSSNNSFGWDFGGGVMGYFNDHFGLRGDIRYMKTFDDNVFGVVNVGKINFTRLSIGVVIR